jgi:hypothetical protein
MSVLKEIVKSEFVELSSQTKDLQLEAAGANRLPKGKYSGD